MIKIDTKNNTHLVNPRQLEIRFESGIPVSELKIIGKTEKSTNSIGAFPTNHRTLGSVLSIDTAGLPKRKIKFETIKNSFPKAIWGNGDKVDTSGNTLVKNVLSGVKITLQPDEPQKKDFKTSGFSEEKITENRTDKHFDYESMLQGYDNELMDNSNHVDIYSKEFLRAKPSLFFNA